MNKLAFAGTIILGLMLLITHLLVTFIIGAGPSFVAGTYDAMGKLEQVKKGMIEAANEFGKELEKELKKTKDDQKAEGEPNYFTEKVLAQQENSFDQNYVNELVKSLNEDSCKVSIPLGSFEYKQTYETKFPTWVSAYGLVGSLLIIIGTALTTTILRKGITQKPNSAKEVEE